MVYFIIFFLLLICIYTFDYRKVDRGEMVAYCTLCLFFILVAGLRYRIGGDSIVYENEYKELPKFSDLDRFHFDTLRYEPGYVVLVSIPRYFSPDFVYFQLLHALIVNTVIFWFIYKNTQNRFLAVTFYFVGLYLNLNTEVLREALAVSIFLLAWPSFRSGKWWLYYPLVLLACCFHISAVFTLFLPLALLPGVRAFFTLGYRTIFFCIVIFFIAMYLQRRFFSIVIDMSGNESMSDKAQLYSKSVYGGATLNVFGIFEQAIKTLILPLGAIWFMRNKLKGQEDTEEYRSLKRMEPIIIVGVYFAVMTMYIFIFTRFNNYVFMFNYVLIASCFFKSLRVRRKNYRLSPLFWVGMFALVFFLNFKAYFGSIKGTSLERYMVYYPYYTVLDPQDDYDREAVIRYFSHQ